MSLALPVGGWDRRARGEEEEEGGRRKKKKEGGGGAVPKGIDGSMVGSMELSYPSHVLTGAGRWQRMENEKVPLLCYSQPSFNG